MLETKIVNRRAFVYTAAAAPLLGKAVPEPLPPYQVVTRFKPSAHPGMPGPYPGRAIRVHSDAAIDVRSGSINQAVVSRMLSRGMQALTGDSRDADCWARFISPKDIVGIKVNCSGAPHVMSSPELVASIVKNLAAVGVPPEHIWVYERFEGQLLSVGYNKCLPQGVHIWAAEGRRGTSLSGYDLDTYVDVDFFGEEDTRSFMTKPVADTFTKIINVPKMKEHQAAGVTGCLKNIAYGNFSNMDRSHRFTKTNTYSFIGTLAAVEPIPSRTVLNIMDGLSAVWHAGPFSEYPQFRFFPKQIVFGTDPVTMDHLLIDLIEAKRKSEGAPSLFDRSQAHLGRDNANPQFNHFIREPGHVEYASHLGLGVYDSTRIKLEAIEL